MIRERSVGRREGGWSVRKGAGGGRKRAVGVEKVVERQGGRKGAGDGRKGAGCEEKGARGEGKAARDGG